MSSDSNHEKFQLENQYLKKRNKTLESEKVKMEDKIQKLQKEIISQTENVQQNIKNAQDMHEKILSQQEEIDDLKNRLKIASNQLRETQQHEQKSINEFQSKLIQLQHDLINRIKDIESENSLLKIKIQDNLVSSKNIKAESDKLSFDYAKLSNDCNNFLLFVSKCYDSTFSTLEEFQKFLTNNKISFTENFTSSNAMTYDVNQKIQKLKTKYINEKAKKCAYKEENQKLQQQLKSDNMKSKSQISKLENDINTLKLQLEKQISFQNDSTSSGPKSSTQPNLQNDSEINSIDELFVPTKAQYDNLKNQFCIISKEKKEAQIDIADLSFQIKQLLKMIKNLKESEAKFKSLSKEFEKQRDKEIANKLNLQSKIDILEAKVESLSSKCIEKDKQLKIFRQHIDQTSENELVSKCKYLKSKCAQLKSITVSQKQLIEKIDVENDKLSSKFKEQSVKITRLESELRNAQTLSLESIKSMKSNQTNSANTSNNSQKINWNECIPKDFPSDDIPSLKQILENDSLTTPGKLQMALTCASESYVNEITNSQFKRDDTQRTLDKIRNGLKTFIPDLCQAILHRSVLLENFIENDELKDTIITAINQNLNCIEELTNLRKQISDQNMEMLKLQKALKQTQNNSKKFNQVKDLKEHLEFLENQLNKVEKEKINLQMEIENQRKTYIEKIRNIKMESDEEFEKAINQIKSKCNEQNKTIISLSSQLDSAPHINSFE